MTEYVIRNMLTGVLVPVIMQSGGRFHWSDSTVCATRLAAGLEYLIDDPPRHEKVYLVERNNPTGSGQTKTEGSIQYEVDRCFRTVTLSDPALTGTAKTAAVNAEADRRLLLVYPMSEQIWGALRASQLIHKKAIAGQNLTAGETNTLSAIDVAMAFVNAIRTSRLALINGGDKTLTQIKDDAAWPSSP